MQTNPHRTLTPLALEVLHLLQERPMHPYEMQQLIQDRGVNHVIKVRAGSLYHSVERLHRLGLIEALETGREGRRPERTVYAITDRGRDDYLTNLRALVRYPQEEYPVFAAAVEMLGSLDPLDAVRLLEDRATALEALIAGTQQVSASLAKRGLPRLATVEVELRLAMVRAELNWVRQLIDDIRSGDLPWTGNTEEQPR
jgi:DNA-binding PadR family transcriptional regulator